MLRFRYAAALLLDRTQKVALKVRLIQLLFVAAVLNQYNARIAIAVAQRHFEHTGFILLKLRRKLHALGNNHISPVVLRSEGIRLVAAVSGLDVYDWGVVVEASSQGVLRGHVLYFWH